MAEFLECRTEGREPRTTSALGVLVPACLGHACWRMAWSMVSDERCWAGLVSDVAWSLYLRWTWRYTGGALALCLLECIGTYGTG